MDAAAATSTRFPRYPVRSAAEGNSGVQQAALKQNNLKSNAMESVRGTFHAQLATVMDSLLAAAVCEIAKIFESSLCEQQAELAHKTQEISILRGKLEKVERRQKAKGGGGEEGQMSSGDAEDNMPEQSQSTSGIIHVHGRLCISFGSFEEPPVYFSCQLVYKLLYCICHFSFPSIGLDVGNESSSHTDSMGGLGKLKEEVTSLDTAPLKPEVTDS